MDGLMKEAAVCCSRTETRSVLSYACKRINGLVTNVVGESDQRFLIISWREEDPLATDQPCQKLTGARFS